MMPACSSKLGCSQAIIGTDVACRRQQSQRPSSLPPVSWQQLAQYFSFGRAACVADLAPLFAAIGDFVEMLPQTAKPIWRSAWKLRPPGSAPIHRAKRDDRHWLADGDDSDPPSTHGNKPKEADPFN
jgi:hypothetical protein